ncbi:hypothetical protein MMC13_002985 [Lambiella insularis]|nr:hypothetical protein [Lambiella insularis]
MLFFFLLTALLFVRFSHTALNEIICHEDHLQRRGSLTHTDAILTGLAFDPRCDAETRRTLAAYMSDLNYSPQLARLFATPEPLEHPMTAAECLDAASLIPDSLLPLDTNNPGTHTRLNLLYPASQRQSVLQYRLNSGFVAGNCAVQIIRQPSRDSNTDGIRHADASAMAHIVYPHAREKALAVIQQCLSGDGGLPRYRFGYVGTKSVLNGRDFYYLIAVTVWSGQPSITNPGEHFYDRNGEMQFGDRGIPEVTGSFPYAHAFGQIAQN